MKTLATIFLAICCTAAPAADTYSVDPNHTHATFSFSHLGFSTFHGKLPVQRGSITLDSAQKTGAVEVTFELKSVATGVPKFDEHLRSKDFFDAGNHPTATFKSTKTAFKGESPSSLSGDLTIKGVTKPVTLEVTSF
ncbi:MAG TPA: YceI family protein, partial [Steroidobacteraceae bacterium]|nr:YceI family protein [Steroidobacteraceae bacterium]